MKISFNDQFLDLKGYPLPQKMDDVLANELAMSSVGNPETMHRWAVTLVNEGCIDVSSDDIKTLSAFIRNSRLTNLAKSQLLERLNSVTPGDELVSYSEKIRTIAKDVEKQIMRDVRKIR